MGSGPLIEKSWQDKDDRVPHTPRTERSSDSDISALRPRSVSSERPHSTARQFTDDATQLLRSVDRTNPAYPQSAGQLTQEALARSEPTSQLVEDSFLKSRHGLAPVLDAIAEARPSMER